MRPAILQSGQPLENVITVVKSTPIGPLGLSPGDHLVRVHVGKDTVSLLSWQAKPGERYRRHDGRSASVLEVPAVGHPDASAWRSSGLADFEDALQVGCAVAGRADVVVTRNLADFAGSSVPVMTPESFLAAYP